MQIIRQIPVLQQRGESKKTTYFGTNIPQISTIKPITQFHNCLIINIPTLVHLFRMNFQNLQPTLLVRKGNLNLSIETAGTEEGGVERVGTIGGHNDFGATKRFKTVHLVEKLRGKAVREDG